MRTARRATRRLSERRVCWKTRVLRWWMQVRPEVRGLFGETALHWAALLGEDRLAAALIKGSDVNLKDEKYNSSPLGWAIPRLFTAPPSNLGNSAVAAIAPVRAATVRPVAPESRTCIPTL